MYASKYDQRENNQKSPRLFTRSSVLTKERKIESMSVFSSFMMTSLTQCVCAMAININSCPRDRMPSGPRSPTLKTTLNLIHGVATTRHRLGTLHCTVQWNVSVSFSRVPCTYSLQLSFFCTRQHTDQTTGTCLSNSPLLISMYKFLAI